MDLQPVSATLRRKARRSLLLTGLALLLCLPPYLGFVPLWTRIAQLNGGAFVLASTGFGLLLIVGPLGVLCGLLATAFLRVEACTQPGETPRGAGDKLAVGGAVLASFAPALAVLGLTLKALVDGTVRYKFPSGMVARGVDPLGYWQGVAFWLMGAAVLALLAGLYWRSRWQRRKRPA